MNFRFQAVLARMLRPKGPVCLGETMWNVSRLPPNEHLCSLNVSTCAADLDMTYAHWELHLSAGSHFEKSFHYALLMPHVILTTLLSRSLIVAPAM